MGRPRKLSPEQEDEIRRLRRDEGLSAAQIAKRIDEKIGLVQAVLRRDDLPETTIGPDGMLRFEGVYLPDQEEVLNREVKELQQWSKLCEQLPDLKMLPGPDPGQHFDPAAYIRRLVASTWKPDDLRLKAAEILLKETRARRKDANEARQQGSVDWNRICATDIPSEAMGRLAGIGANALLLDAAPFIADPKTPPAVVELWYLTGEHVEAEVAAAILGELRPAIDKAITAAKATRAAPAAQNTDPVWKDNPVVPQG